VRADDALDVRWRDHSRHGLERVEHRLEHAFAEPIEGRACAERRLERRAGRDHRQARAELARRRLAAPIGHDAEHPAIAGASVCSVLPVTADDRVVPAEHRAARSRP
jgi:hypothetical protein